LKCDNEPLKKQQCLGAASTSQTVDEPAAGQCSAHDEEQVTDAIPQEDLEMIVVQAAEDGVEEPAATQRDSVAVRPF
jgi:hypothetical protein